LDNRESTAQKNKVKHSVSNGESRVLLRQEYFFFLRQEYMELLKVCLCLQEDRSNSTMGALLDGMMADCGVEVTQEILLSSSFQLATSEDQIRVICQRLGNVARQRPEM
jgi:hypothetical protein